MNFQKTKNKIKKSLRDLMRLLNSQNGKLKMGLPIQLQPKQFVTLAPPLAQKPKRKKTRMPKQIYSFKGSAYNGKGSVNADAHTFRKSRG